MKALPALRKNKKKGFTLVEIIVVLVIIAILMASLAPVIIGWIREAQDTALIAEGTSLRTAATAIYVDWVGRGSGAIGTSATDVKTWTHRTMSGSNIWNILGDTTTPGAVATAPPPFGGTSPAAVMQATITSNQITRVVYQRVATGRIAVWSLNADTSVTPNLTAGWQVVTTAPAAPVVTPSA